MPYQDWAIIPHPASPRILLLPGAEGWALPLAEHADRHFWQSVAPLNQAIRALLEATLFT